MYSQNAFDPILTGFSIPIKIIQLLIFSNNRFLKQQYVHLNYQN